jgi:hypothetical protein
MSSARSRELKKDAEQISAVKTKTFQIDRDSSHVDHGDRMRIKSIAVSSILLISAFMLLASCGKKKAEWKGTIEEQ